MKRLFLVISLFLFLVYGTATCTLKDQSYTVNGVAERSRVCLSPVVDFSYPISPPNDMSSIKMIPPTSPWKADIELPKSAKQAYGANLILIGDRDSYKEFWIRRFYNVGTEQILDITVPKTSVEYLMYRDDIHQWVSMFDDADRKLMSELDMLFATTDNNVWGLLIDNAGNISLYKYNEIEIGFHSFADPLYKFEVSKDSQRILKAELKSMSITPDGILWIIQRGNLYGYDLSQLKLPRYVLSAEDVGVSFSGVLEISTDGLVYLFNSTLPELIVFDPTDQSVGRQYIPVVTDETGMAMAGFADNINLLTSAFFDRRGHLWVNDYGWMNPEGTWYSIIRSPIFISDSASDSFLKYHWIRPNLALESNDGLLWFKSINGWASLNPEKGEWCWFTTYRSNIVEDSDHNLWMIADGKLYKYTLGE